MVSSNFAQGFCLNLSKDDVLCMEISVVCMDIVEMSEWIEENQEN